MMKRARSPNEKPKLGSLVSAVGAELVGLGTLLYYLIIGKNKLVISLHYSGWQAHVRIIIGFCLLCLGIITWKVRGLQKWRKKNGLVKTKPKQPSLIETPEEVYKFIQTLLRQTDDCNREELRKIQAQLDEMNDLQDRLNVLLQMNRCQDSLKEAQDLLQETEDAICLNVRKLINYVTVGADDLMTNHLPQTITDNRKLLDDAKDILKDLAEFINNGKGDIEMVTQRIKSYRMIIEEMLEEDGNEKHDEKNPGGDDGYCPTIHVDSMSGQN